MADAYGREEQNNALLSSLSQKTSALKHITLDIYDNARSQGTLDNTNEVFSSMSTNIRGSAGRLTRMARQGDKVAVLKVAGIIVVGGLLVWWIGGWILGLFFGR
ncbi:blocked early in transport 1 [Cladophialophora psammophila CBS 110553]|uniref:Blocked early in transport 1 n=1 Tax=Cladophialophora psammophila CBS 110553 TaxID=1182543 RepID=W9X799_9EURO|nr:blocked early in transport 1 [Cladophialophora psammophila CBS 110553]EXJ72801.1 blocked early in transport 1 [Cladophialophora psammophila CBS 110553]